MATRTGSKKLGKTNGWGIAERALDGSYNLIAIGFGRNEIRSMKREVYPGVNFRTVKVTATFEAYAK